MKEVLEYLYFRNMSLNEWLSANSKTYNAESWKKQEESEDIPFEDIGKSFKEITDYVLVGTNINPNENYDKLICENQKFDEVDGIPEYLEKLSKDVYFPA